MSDEAVLTGYVELWWQAIGDFTALLEDLPAEQWSTPTDLAGWDVRAVAAHTAHLESVLASGVEEQAEVGEAPHILGFMGQYTEIGVVNRRTSSPAEIVAEIRDAATRRHDALLADPPTDAVAAPAYVFGGVPWNVGVLLRNRPLDVWMHEQDVRRAVGRPGGLDAPAAAHCADYLAEGFGFVLAKKTRAAPGTTAVLAIEGHTPYSFTVNDAGRGERLAEPPADPTVRLGMDRETFLLLAGGRRAVETGRLVVDGDADLGDRILAQLATTP